MGLLAESRVQNHKNTIAKIHRSRWRDVPVVKVNGPGDPRSLGGRGENDQFVGLACDPGAGFRLAPRRLKL